MRMRVITGFDLPVAAVALVGFGVAVAGCGASGDGEARAEQSGGAEDVAGARVVNVEVMPIVPSSFVDYIRITGEVEALHDVTISAEESGPVARYAVPKGARVRRGQLIAKIDDTVLRAQVEEARALAELAREQFERRRRLWEAEQIGSEIAYLQLKSQAEAAEARLRTLEARLARTEVRAPVAGIFDEKFVEVGEMVAPGTPVARVVATRQVKVVGGVPERFAMDISPGDSARVTFDVLPGREFVGGISFVGAGVDAPTRTVPVELVLDNTEQLVKPRMVANVQIERTRRTGVIVVPQDVVRRGADGYIVFVVADSGGRPRAVARQVELGPSYQNRVVVESGLEPGERLITVGSGLVDDGSLIHIVSAGEAPDG